MYDIIKRLLKWLLPILRTAGVQAAADVINDVAYPRPGINRYGYQRHNRIGVRPGPNVPRPRTYGSADYSGLGFKPRVVEDGFHDVLLVAFDITAVNRSAAEAFIENYMPLTGRQTFDGQQINLDSFWIADDDRLGNSDTDSAVFVAKGNQKAARELLHSNGLVG